MKKILLPFLLVSSCALAQSVPLNAPVMPRTASTVTVAKQPLPLAGRIALLNAQGQVIGQLTPSGLLFSGNHSGEVVGMHVISMPGMDTRNTSYRLLMNSKVQVEGFGPAGQRLLLDIPNLKRVTWVGPTGRTTVLNLR